jgi:hypothetical protein
MEEEVSIVEEALMVEGELAVMLALKQIHP